MTGFVEVLPFAAGTCADGKHRHGFFWGMQGWPLHEHYFAESIFFILSESVIVLLDDRGILQLWILTLQWSFLHMRGRSVRESSIPGIVLWHQGQQ